MFATPKRNFITVVHQAEIAYREFLGANRVRLEPGLRLNLPVLHQLKRVDMREQIHSIPQLAAYTKDNVPVNVTGTLFYKATDAEKASYEIQNYHTSVAAVGESCFRATVGRFEFDQIIAHRNELNAELVKVIGSSLDKWGIACSRCEVQHVGPQNKDVAHQLEKQMEAERRRRENELDTQAHIRTAEGVKQQKILESEGALEAANNETNALKYQMETESAALAGQIAKITEANGGDEVAACSFLLEMKRLEHLKKVAEGKNRVYFVDPKGSFPTAVPVVDLMKKDNKY
jgi:regulator of protease activity HflC (stomatin/prohibitin superfamily)